MDELLFILTEDHIKLLRNANVNWWRDMCGAPAIDAKRPYDDSDLVWSMAEILDIALDSEDDSAEADLVREQLLNLHRETKTALEVILQTGAFTPGVYRRNAPWSHWNLVPQPEES